MLTIREKIESLVSSFTASERKISNVILSDYPFAGLNTIHELADTSGVSAPSITRFINKLNCYGYQAFQQALIAELKESHRSPVELKLTEMPASSKSFLHDYSVRVAKQAESISNTISQQQFDSICAFIEDPSCNIFLLGGRVTDSIASLFAIHLRQIRDRIYHLSSNPEIWPDDVLRMRKRDLVILFDFRRYQTNLTDLAQVISSRRKSTIVAVTDRWMSPLSRYADHVLCIPTEVGTAWDSQVSAVILIEAMIVQVSEKNWDGTRKRIHQWDNVRLTPPVGSSEKP